MFALLRVGLIPARAGKTEHLPTIPTNEGAHPRSRGENVRWRRRCLCPVGSSPLARGKLARVPAHPTRFRLIPARAGKTSGVGIVGATVAAHPRSRGENVGDFFDLTAEDGSSPLARGKLCSLGSRPSIRTLIPARAGKTQTSRTDRPPTSAHPRSRGENSAAFRDRARQTGSSPLARGKLQATHPRRT